MSIKKKKRICMTEYNKRIIAPMETREAIEEMIRELADCDEGFENLVFELGLSVLRKEILKQTIF